ncbi:hypothetical protein ACH4OQ_06415 [Streptomyces luteogriseus]|uniref:hypothetical protein n=1 Tax=Streptomyces luteogriseus TaxID=68233 RepID=UPI0037B4E40E
MTVRTRLLDPAVGRALLATWEEAAGVFDERERAAPALTEAVTVLTAAFVPDEVYERAPGTSTRRGRPIWSGRSSPSTTGTG